MENNRQIITPAEYFEQLKQLKHENTNESLDTFYDASLALMKKYKLLGQKKMIRKLMFIVNCIPKEKQLLDMGINTFIYKDDIEEYINTVDKKVVKIIELENYPRDIPDELIPIIQTTQDIFDEYFVLFTDYTGKVERQVEKELQHRQMARDEAQALMSEWGFDSPEIDTAMFIQSNFAELLDQDPACPW